VCWLLLVITGLFGCSSAPTEGEQARTLIAALTDLSEDDAPDVRHRRLLALKRLPLTHVALQETRDRCVEAHTALMLAEAAQAMARAQLKQAQPAGDGALAPGATAEIAKAIRRSNTQLEVATSAFAGCRDETRRLAVAHR